MLYLQINNAKVSKFGHYVALEKLTLVSHLAVADNTIIVTSHDFQKSVFG